MKALSLLIHIMVTGITLQVFEKEILKISMVIRENPFETFMVLGMIILLLKFYSTKEYV